MALLPMSHHFGILHVPLQCSSLFTNFRSADTVSYFTINNMSTHEPRSLLVHFENSSEKLRISAAFWRLKISSTGPGFFILLVYAAFMYQPDIIQPLLLPKLLISSAVGQTSAWLVFKQ